MIGIQMLGVCSCRRRCRGELNLQMISMNRFGRERQIMGAGRRSDLR